MLPAVLMMLHRYVPEKVQVVTRFLFLPRLAGMKSSKGLKSRDFIVSEETLSPEAPVRPLMSEMSCNQLDHALRSSQSAHDQTTPT
jgi:hypothetical protein